MTNNNAIFWHTMQQKLAKPTTIQFKNVRRWRYNGGHGNCCLFSPNFANVL